MWCIPLPKVRLGGGGAGVIICGVMCSYQTICCIELSEVLKLVIFNFVNFWRGLMMVTFVGLPIQYTQHTTTFRKLDLFPKNCAVRRRLAFYAWVSVFLSENWNKFEICADEIISRGFYLRFLR
jgi:hypothetical protein